MTRLVFGRAILLGLIHFRFKQLGFISGLLFIVLIPDLPACAQDGHYAPLSYKPAHYMSEIMTVNLHLDSTQQVSVAAILNASITQLNSAYQQFPAHSTVLKNEIERLGNESIAQLQVVLTPSQYQEYLSTKSKLQKQMRRKLARSSQ